MFIFMLLLALAQPLAGERGERVAPSEKTSISVNIGEDGVEAYLYTFGDIQRIVLLEPTEEGGLRLLTSYTVDPITGDVGGVAAVSCASNAVGGVCCMSENAGVMRMVCTQCVSMTCSVILNVVVPNG